MINEVISKHFAEFVIRNLENNNRYEGMGSVINVGFYKGTEVVVLENNDGNWLRKIKTSQDVYALLLLECQRLQHISYRSPILKNK